jgi:hypothetical protein
MEKTIRLLAVALAVQVLLALGLSFTGPDLSAPAAGKPLLTFAAGTVDRITIEGPAAAKVTLVHGDGGWNLPDAAGFPADGDRVAELLKRLAALTGGTPLATTPGAQQRFRVSDADFERRITLNAGDKVLGTLYLGAAPNMRQINARAADSEAIFAVELGAHEFPVKTDDWIDRGLLRLSREEITAIDVAGLHLERLPDPAPAAGSDAKGNPDAKDQAETASTDTAKGHWQATGLAAGESLAGAAADTLAAKLADLTIGGVLGTEEKPEYGLGQPALSLKVTRKGGAQLDYRLGKAAQKEEYALKVSSRPEYFRLPAYVADQLVKAAARDTLTGGGAETQSPEHKGDGITAASAKPAGKTAATAPKR